MLAYFVEYGSRAYGNETEEFETEEEAREFAKEVFFKRGVDFVTAYDQDWNMIHLDGYGNADHLIAKK